MERRPDDRDLSEPPRRIRRERMASAQQDGAAAPSSGSSKESMRPSEVSPLVAIRRHSRCVHAEGNPALSKRSVRSQTWSSESRMAASSSSAGKCSASQHLCRNAGGRHARYRWRLPRPRSRRSACRSGHKGRGRQGGTPRWPRRAWGSPRRARSGGPWIRSKSCDVC
jgi:hypothetical protein